MKNYYEILEVDKNASQEVIEKAYRTLAKKYHPDLQQGQKQQEYAEKMKIINQAYDVLSNSFQREEYNKKLENERILRERLQYEKMKNEAMSSVKNQPVGENSILNMSRVLRQEMNAARKMAYHDAYMQDMKNRGYKIKYKRDLNYYLNLIKALVIIIVVGFIIYQIPPVKNFFIELYNENVIFKAIIDIFKNTFSATF